MTESNTPPINPFLAARKSTGVHASLEVHDVLALRPEWTELKASGFMDRHAAVIAHAMLRAGTDVIAQLLEDQ